MGTRAIARTTDVARLPSVRPDGPQRARTEVGVAADWFALGRDVKLDKENRACPYASGVFRSRSQDDPPCGETWRYKGEAHHDGECDKSSTV